MSANQWMKHAEVAAFLVISLVIGFVLQFLEVTASWAQNPSSWIAGIAGFYLAYYTFFWLAKEQNVKVTQNPLFILGLVVLGWLAYIVAVSFYFQNNAMLSGQTPVAALGTGFDHALSNWWNYLKQDAYLQFLLSVVFAWIAFLVLSKRHS